MRKRINMAEGFERMQLRSMTDKEKEGDPNQGEARETNQARKRTQPVDPTDNTVNPIDGLDDIDRALRVSTKQVKKFWYLPDLKNTRLREIAETRLPHPGDPVKILINAPELKQFFPTTTFEICLDTDKMYTYTEPKVDIVIGLEPNPFDIEELENHYRNQTRAEEVEHWMERIPLMERTIPTTEVMPLEEFESNVNKTFQVMSVVRKSIMRIVPSISSVRLRNNKGIRHLAAIY